MKVLVLMIVHFAPRNSRKGVVVIKNYQYSAYENAENDRCLIVMGTAIISNYSWLVLRMIDTKF